MCVHMTITNVCYICIDISYLDIFFYIVTLYSIFDTHTHTHTRLYVCLCVL